VSDPEYPTSKPRKGADAVVSQPKTYIEKIQDCVRNLMAGEGTAKDFAAVLGHIQSKGHLFAVAETDKQMYNRDFVIGLMADFDFYTTSGNFQIDYNLALEGLPRSGKKERIDGRRS